jgi:hypothetical protein
MPHLPTKEIQSLIMSKWRNGISEAEKKEYEVLAEE